MLTERIGIYDIYEQMDDPEVHFTHYTTEIDLSSLLELYPYPVRRTLLISGKRDLLSYEASRLSQKQGEPLAIGNRGRSSG